ncbi:hypothetical protein PVAG01_09992 [Phlyctema vagabunda]|uniref:Diaminohydroxyphosphoribosylamino-pyrimidine deaminase n=1 Tax=Phlyctema vagabunda TaxID=108571 RepID=A0ABR4P4N2_9HELO
MSSLAGFIESRGPEIEDTEEESFLLFSQSLPSQNLGFVDAKATVLDLSIAGRDLTIHQSPTILSSNRGGGTTGAVVWKITPLFASWITSGSPTNMLFRHGVLDSTSNVLELGCGISGIIGLALAPQIRSYVLTDQEYVLKLLNQNLQENQQDPASAARKGRKSASKLKRGSVPASAVTSINNVTARTLDWETDEVASCLVDAASSFDAVIACDCIYNDALIEPLVQTCVDACNLRSLDAAADQKNPTVCIVAQQLRSDEVFESWLRAFQRSFRVWRVPDAELIDGLRSDSGFVVHVGILR